MCRIFSFLRTDFPLHLQIPSYIRGEFAEESVRKNDFSLLLICVIIFAVETCNLIRVVWISSRGLETQNNRIYFSMYCLLIALAALWLVTRHLLRHAPASRQQAAQLIFIEMLFLWHMGLNTYDLCRDSSAGTAVLTTALLGRSLLIQAPPLYCIVQLAADYGLFRVFMAPLLDGGNRLNLTISFAVSLAAFLAKNHHTALSLKQQKQILEMNIKLQELVQSDPLTGLLNKTTVELQAENLLRSQAHGGVTLFLLDLDRFKGINDHYGHPCGDHVLVETAESMREAFFQAVGLGRVGGDEFAVLFDRPMTEECAAALYRAFEGRLAHIQWQGRPMEISCSIGVCVCTPPPCAYQQLYQEADRMLYQAKEAGGGQCRVQRLHSGAGD